MQDTGPLKDRLKYARRKSTAAIHTFIKEHRRPSSGEAAGAPAAEEHSNPAEEAGVVTADERRVIELQTLFFDARNHVGAACRIAHRVASSLADTASRQTSLVNALQLAAESLQLEDTDNMPQVGAAADGTDGGGAFVRADILAPLTDVAGEMQRVVPLLNDFERKVTERDHYIAKVKNLETTNDPKLASNRAKLSAATNAAVEVAAKARDVLERVLENSASVVALATSNLLTQQIRSTQASYVRELTRLQSDPGWLARATSVVDQRGNAIANTIAELRSMKIDGVSVKPTSSRAFARANNVVTHPSIGAKSEETLARELEAARKEIARLGTQLDKGAAAWDARADEMWGMQKRAEKAEAERDRMRKRVELLECGAKCAARAKGDPFEASAGYSGGESLVAAATALDAPMPGDAAAAFGVSLRRSSNPFSDAEESPKAMAGSSRNPFDDTPRNPFDDEVDNTSIFATASARRASVSPPPAPEPHIRKTPPSPAPPRRRPSVPAEGGPYQRLQND